MIFTIVVLIFSAVIHEVAHGWTAYKLGDPTAKNLGRLTLNPISHLDPVGSIVLPLLLVLAKSSFLIGWAKPVPYNPYNLHDQKYGEVKVAASGPGSNLIIATIFGLLARFLPISTVLKQNLVYNGFLGGNYDFLLSEMNGSLINSVFVMAIVICFINLLLMAFNLIPVPPLDGSKVLMGFLSTDWKIRFQQIEPYGIFIVFFLLFAGLISLILYPILFLFRLFVGV